MSGLSTTGLEPLGKKILDELAELPSPAFLQQGDLGALVGVLANAGSDLVEVWITALAARPSPLKR